MKKKILLSTAIILLSFKVFSQTKEKELTQAEQFSSQAGTLIERQFIDIGKIKSIEIKVLKYKDLNANVSKSALRFEFEYKSTYTNDTKIASLDVDEIDGLIKSIKNLQTNVFTTTREIYTEVTFKSRTGFEAGAYFSPDKVKWTTYIQLEKNDRNSMIFLSTEDFTVLLNIIELAKTKL